jgi:hypothetical protein
LGFGPDVFDPEAMLSALMATGMPLPEAVASLVPHVQTPEEVVELVGACVGWAAQGRAAGDPKQAEEGLRSALLPLFDLRVRMEMPGHPWPEGLRRACEAHGVNPLSLCLSSGNALPLRNLAIRLGAAQWAVDAFLPERSAVDWVASVKTPATPEAVSLRFCPGRATPPPGLGQEDIDAVFGNLILPGTIEIEGWDALRSWPAGTMVRHLDLRKLPNLERVGSLPFAGKLGLRLCPKVTELPSSLRLGEWLVLDRLPALVAPPATVTIVYGVTQGLDPTAIRIDKCRNLEAAPRLHLNHGAVVITNCSALRTFPEGPTEIKGILDLRGCRALEALPASLALVQNRLILTGCASLTALPPRLVCNHAIRLDKCVNLRSLEGLRTDYDSISLTGCSAWDGELPEGIGKKVEIRTEAEPNGIQADHYRRIQVLERRVAELEAAAKPDLGELG